MKHFLLYCLLATSAIGHAQSPEPVYSIATEIREPDWYKQQLKLWKSETEKRPHDGNAWTNYYLAARALRNVYSGNPSESALWREQCAVIVQDVHKAHPNSFEDYYLNFINAGNFEDTDLLSKAAAISPFDDRILDEMLIYNHLQLNTPGFKTYAEKMFQRNAMAPACLNWGHNVLAELEPNAILFTFGDNDTYAAWINQGALNFRNDVTVINTSLILLDGYRKKLLDALGIAPLNLKYDEAKDAQEFQNQILEHILNSGKAVYISVTGAGSFPERFKPNMYLTGLAYKFSKTPFESTPIIVRNFENRYLLDYLEQSFTWHVAQQKVPEINSMYLPAMLKLHDYYAETEQVVKLQKLDNLILKISEASGQQSEVLSILDKRTESSPILVTALDTKTMEKNMAFFKPGIAMAKTELTNAEYHQFLNSLKSSGRADEYHRFIYDSTAWNRDAPGSEAIGAMYHWHPAYENYPVVNISYDAAVAYCSWLTEQYNSQRKRTYTKVLFRLPTPEEWRFAATSGKATARSPFVDDNIKSCEDGCYRANIRPQLNRLFEDGGYHTVKVVSYDPNSLGMYNTVGNVSEMTSVRGVALGGSWYSLPDEWLFDKTQKYSESNPFTGLRVLMEVVQE